MLAILLLGAMVLVSLLFWGPLPIAWLWVGSQVDYATDSTFFGIFVAFIGLLFSLIIGLMIMRRIDLMWILARRAGGFDQRSGVIGPVFAITAVLGASLFFVWLFLIEGPGSSLGPAQSS